MKKLLLLSAFCIFAQIRTDEGKLPEIELDGGRTITLKDFKNLLENISVEEIQNDVKSVIDPATGQFVTIEDGESLKLKTTSLGHGCQQIIDILDLHEDKWINLNPAHKEQLQQLLFLCSGFFSNAKEAITHSLLISGEKDRTIEVLTRLQNKAIELMRK